eukprot:4179193-Alexandrium_andersonii.AAC.1
MPDLRFSCTRKPAMSSRAPAQQTLTAGGKAPNAWRRRRTSIRTAAFERPSAPAGPRHRRQAK